MNDNYWCPVCTYIYLPYEGDPTQDVPPGMEFDDLPEDWHCPICFSEKDSFIRGLY